MSGTVSRDSISRCDDGNSIYSTIRNHQTPRQLPAANSMDKFIAKPEESPQESVQARLNREMFNKVDKMSMPLPHDSFVAVVQVGKYLVLAIMLPPYLLLYGIPKWFFSVAVPQAMDFAKQQFTRLGQMFQQWSNKVVDLMKGALDQTLGEALRMMQQQGKRFLNYANEMMKWPGKALTAMVEKGQKALSGPYNSVKNSASELSEVFQQQTRRLAEAAEEAAAALRRFAERTLGLKDSLKSEKFAPGIFHNSITSNASALALWMTNQVKNGYQKTLESGSDLLASLMAKGRSLVDYLKDASKMADLSFLKDRFDAIKEKAMEKINEFADKCSDIYNKASEKVEQAVQQAAQVMMKNVMAIPQATFQAVLWTYRLIPEKRRAQLSRHYQRGRRFCAHVYGMYEGAKRGVKAAFSFVTKAHSIIKEEILKWIAWVIKKLVQAKDYVVALPCENLQVFAVYLSGYKKRCRTICICPAAILRTYLGR